MAFRDRLVNGENYIRLDDPSDVKSLAETLRSWLSDSAALRELGAAGAALAADLADLNRPDGPTVAIEAALAELQAER